MFSKIFLALMVLTLTFSVNAQVQGDLIQPSASIQITTDSFHSAIDTGQLGVDMCLQRADVSLRRDDDQSGC